MQEQIVYRTVPKALLAPVKPVLPVVNAEVVGSCESAFQSVSVAYIATMERIAKKNADLELAVKYNEKGSDKDGK